MDMPQLTNDEHRLLASLTGGKTTIAASVAAVAIVVLTGLYAVGSTDQRAILNFMVLAAAVVGGVIGALFVGAGLRLSVIQRAMLRQEQRAHTALGYLKRWNDPSFFALKNEARQILRQLRDDPAGGLQTLESDFHRRAVLADFLNFFEEVGFAAKSGAADSDMLAELFRTSCNSYYSAAARWIAAKRSAGSPAALSNFEWLHERFSRRPEAP